VLLIAVGAYQLAEAVKAAERLQRRGVATRLVCVIEPGRFRIARDAHEQRIVASEAQLAALFPPSAEVRVILGHTRPEPLTGLLRRLDSGASRTTVLGYTSRGGTLDVGGMLYANRCTWAHAVAAAAACMGRQVQELLDDAELAAVEGRGDPATILSAY
jgi:phosphoketolase